MPEEVEGLYSRQRLLNLDVPVEVVIAGVGGVGSWAAILAAMSGIPRLYLYDHDVLEESNRNRLPFCQSSINRPKVDVTAEFIRGIRSDALVVPIQSKLTADILKAHITASHPIVMDFTDSPKSQLLLFNTCLEQENRFIRAGYDGTHMTVTSVVGGWIKNVEEEEYEIQPSWVVPSVICAALAVGKLMKFFDQEVCLDISEIGIPVLQRQKKKTARCYQPTSSEPEGAATPPEEVSVSRTVRVRTRRTT